MSGATGLVLTIFREFEAPRELVFRAWTERALLMKWLCPAGFTTTTGAMDVRPGGAWRAGMRAPDGAEFVAFGEYREIVPPERLVMTHMWDEPGVPPHETVITVTLAERGGKTVMTFEQSGFVSAVSRDSHGEGWGGAFENLGEALRLARVPAGR